MSQPLVSVLTPSFNQARWLGDTLRSVEAQTYPYVEHVVMDGVSTDGSRQLLEQAGPRVRWWSEQDRGQSHALNKAFERSRGEIIGWLNSDDAYFDERVVEDVVTCFTQRPDVDVVYGHSALVNGDGLILHMIWVPPFNYELLRLHNFIIQPAAFVRRTAFGNVAVDERYEYAMDRELWTRLGRSHRFARLDRVLAIDRHHPTRKSYVRLDLAEIDTERLRVTYGIRTGALAVASQKVVKVALRLAGLSLVRRVSGTLTFDGRHDGLFRLAVRQAVVRRVSMPAGDLASAAPDAAP